MPGPDKAALRAELLARRRGMPPDEVARLSARIIDRLRDLPAWRGALEVLLYVPVRGEVDVAPLMNELWTRGVRVLLPRCRPGVPGMMDLAACGGMDELVPGSFGIPEPLADACLAPGDCAPDLVLVPAVGLDRRGMRLGHGAGYYDRLLARPDVSGALLAAPAYSFQLLDGLPADPWDKPVDLIVTEHETVWTETA